MVKSTVERVESARKGRRLTADDWDAWRRGGGRVRQPRAHNERDQRATGRAEVHLADRAAGDVGDDGVDGEGLYLTNPVRVGFPCCLVASIEERKCGDKLTVRNGDSRWAVGCYRSRQAHT